MTAKSAMIPAIRIEVLNQLPSIAIVSIAAVVPVT